jgi:dimethylaniline monooxygenase (N-oxide forming)
MSLSFLPLWRSQGVQRNPNRPVATFADWVRTPGADVEFEKTDRQLPVLIVGAGPAGLAAMGEMKRANIAFQAVELNRGVGGIWDQSNPESTVYDSLTTNTSHHTTHLGMPVPKKWPAFPSHASMLNYLQSFAETKGLSSNIRFSTLFVGARKSPRGTWIAKLRVVGESQERETEFRGLVFATGLNIKRNSIIPNGLREQAVAARLPAIHSSNYRNASPYAGRRVLLIGAGVSATAIADEVSRVARRTILSFRTPRWIVPANVFGQPSDVAATGPASMLPFWIQQHSLGALVAMTYGNPYRRGLPVPKHRLLERFAVTDYGIMQALEAERVHVRSDVARIDDGRAFFTNTDEEPEPIDAVIFATGYTRRYPLTEPTVPGESLSDSLPFLVFHRTEPGLFYMAETIAPSSGWPVFLEQGRAIAAYLSSEARDGGNARAFHARRGVASPDFKQGWYREADGFHINVRAYTRNMRKLVNWLAD